MDTEAFWRVLDAAKDSDKPLDVAIVDHLSASPAEEILAFEHRFSRLRDAVYRRDVWAAAYLIGGGCSDDRFSDFTAGLGALGREWYEQAAACPDARRASCRTYRGSHRGPGHRLRRRLQLRIVQGIQAADRRD